jgi:predicted membrane protein
VNVLLAPIIAVFLFLAIAQNVPKPLLVVCLAVVVVFGLLYWIASVRSERQERK